MDIFCFEQCRLKTFGKPIDEKNFPEHKSMILSEFCLLQYEMFINAPPFKNIFCNIAGTPLFRNLILSTILQQLFLVYVNVVYEKVMCFNWYFFSLGVFRVRLFLIEKTANNFSEYYWVYFFMVSFYLIFDAQWPKADNLATSPHLDLHCVVITYW